MTQEQSVKLQRLQPEHLGRRWNPATAWVQIQDLGVADTFDYENQIEFGSAINSPTTQTSKPRDQSKGIRLHWSRVHT